MRTSLNALAFMIGMAVPVSLIFIEIARAL